MTEIVSKPAHGTPIITLQEGDGFANSNLQVHLDDLTEKLNQFLLGDSVILPEYTVATVPAAASNDNGAIIVSDETGGRTIATSDGTNWRRVSDGAIIS